MDLFAICSHVRDGVFHRDGLSIVSDAIRRRSRKIDAEEPGFPFPRNCV